MSRRDWDVLFSEFDLRAVLEAQRGRVKDLVMKIEPSRFEKESDEELAAVVASTLVVEPLVLLEDEISVSQKDAKVDVSHDFNRGIHDRSRPFYVDGVEVTYHVPYAGNSELWKCGPPGFDFNPPRAVLTPGELRFPYEQAEGDIAATKHSFVTDLGAIKQKLPEVNALVNEHNQSLESVVRRQVSGRRAVLGRKAADLSTLGYKIREAGKPASNHESTVAATPDRSSKRAAARKKDRKMYDVALSFAGEERPYVERVASELQSLGVTVFYDEFAKVELWGKDLAEHLGHVYGTNSRFVVLFISRAYASKAWPNHEKRHALARQVKEGAGHILPVRFDDTELPGLPSSIAFLDLRVLTPEKLAELIRQKVDTHDA